MKVKRAGLILVLMIILINIFNSNSFANTNSVITKEDSIYKIVLGANSKKTIEIQVDNMQEDSNIEIGEFRK